MARSLGLCLSATLRIWAEPFTELRLPKMFDLRADPIEQADITSNPCYDWLLCHAFLIVPARKYAATFLGTFKEYPPAQAPASFTHQDSEEAVRGR